VRACKDRAAAVGAGLQENEAGSTVALRACEARRDSRREPGQGACGG
jgi:hypothetical protein